METTEYSLLAGDGIVPLMLSLETILLKTVVIVICVAPLKSLLLKAMDYVEAHARMLTLVERKLAMDGLPRIDDVASASSLVRKC